jgi:hypothetical protein
MKNKTVERKDLTVLLKDSIDKKVKRSFKNVDKESKEFLKEEYDKAFSGELTEDCRTGGCYNCDVCYDFDVQMEIIGDDNDAD